MVAVIGTAVALETVKGLIFPVPFAPSPIVGVSFDQLYVVFATVDPPKVTPLVKAPSQTI